MTLINGSDSVPEDGVLNGMNRDFKLSYATATEILSEDEDLNISGGSTPSHTILTEISNGHDDARYTNNAMGPQNCPATASGISSGNNTKHDRHDPTAPIAVCGMAMRLPGGIRDAGGFWDMLVSGRDARAPIPSDRYNTEGFNNSLGAKGAIETAWGYFLDEELATIDTSFFSMTRHEVERLDPQQRQVLEVARECLDNAGEVEYRGKTIGCYVGTFGEDWLQVITKESQPSGRNLLPGYSDLMVANRISYELDLHGPSMVIKTGCSASLVGLHEACTALRMGHCSAAIVAGTSLITNPATTAAMTREGIVSPNGSCRTFDADADGFARGEAINAVYIKRLDDAMRDGNPVRAVIRNTGTNSDGKGSNLLQPNGIAHELLMRDVYQSAGLSPDDTAFVECHGTGTPIGDPIEAVAVGNVFGEKGIYIGSVKPNVGHSEGASGLTSFIKAVLALEHEMIPPNIKFDSPNPLIPFHEKGLIVPIKAIAWPTDRAHRVSINSFGIGGANAHVIIDAPSKVGKEINGTVTNGKLTTETLTSGTPKKQEQQLSLLLLSANTEHSLERLVSQNLGYAETYPERCVDLAYTLARGRQHMPFRSFSVAGTAVETKAAPSREIPIDSHSLVMIFSGQGAQWPQMGLELLDTDKEFRDDIKAMDRILQTLINRPEWTIEDELRKPRTTSRVNQAEFSQPICTAIQIGLVNVFKRYGVRPDAVVGHSSGEIAAAYISGALSLTAALVVAYYRGYVMKKTAAEDGAMAVIGLGMNETANLLEDGVVVACENDPSNTTISGENGQLEKMLKDFQKDMPNVFCRKLNVDKAYHSHHMKVPSQEYRVLVEEEFRRKALFPTNSSISFFSSVTRNIVEDNESLDSQYWATNLTSTVLFSSTVANIIRHQPNRVFLEIGPHSTLASPIRRICSKANSPCMYAPTMIRENNSAETLLSALGLLYQFDIAFDSKELFPHGRILSDLPQYPWDHQTSYWYESRASKDWRFRKHGHHSLLGLRIIETTDIEPCWRNVLYTEDEPWLRDHRIGNDVIFPFAGYCAMTGEAFRQVSGIESGYCLENVAARSAIIMDDSAPNEIVTSLRSLPASGSFGSGSWSFTISSRSESSWVLNCEGLVRPRRTAQAEMPRTTACLRSLQPSKWYEAFADVGVTCGPRFQSLSSIISSTTANLAKARILGAEANPKTAFTMHPSAIDACLQLLMIARIQGLCRNLTSLAIPTLIEELEVSHSTSDMEATAWWPDEDGAVGVQCTADGNMVLRLSGLQVTSIDEKEEDKSTGISARLEWRPDFDFVDHRTLFVPPPLNIEKTVLQEELTFLCIIDTAQSLENLHSKKPHLNKFQRWLSKEISKAQLDTHLMLQFPQSTLLASHEARVAMINEKHQEILTISEKDTIAEGTLRIWRNIENLFNARDETIDILMKDNFLTELYSNHSFDHSRFIDLLSHKKPNLRILEVGAGTGGTTQTFLQDLVDLDGNPMYSLYTFSDISAGFFPRAKERFAFAPNMDYKTFDVSRSPLEQGFEVQSYDLILAANVIHATPVLQDTLRNLSPLLRTDGHLVMTELAGSLRAINYIFGALPGWWLGEADDRPDKPYVEADRWDQELKSAGFTGVDTVVYDAPEPYRSDVVIVSRPQQETRNVEHCRPVVILCDKPAGSIATTLMAAFVRGGCDVSLFKLGEKVRPGSDIVSVLDLEGGLLEEISPSRYYALQELIRNHSAQKMLWLILPSQIFCSDLKAAHSAQFIGLARTLRSELAMPLYTLEIEATEAEFASLTLQVMQKIQIWQETEDDPDREYSIHKGQVHVGRYHPFALEKAIRAPSDTSTSKAAPLTKNKDTPQPSGHETKAIAEDHVEIEVLAVGQDNASSSIEMPESGNAPRVLGLSGCVSRVGARVEHLSVGERVMAIAPLADSETYAILPASLVVTVPKSLSLGDAVTDISLSWYGEWKNNQVQALDKIDRCQPTQGTKGCVCENVDHSRQLISNKKTAIKNPDISFDSKAAYILTGGFGGLGRSVATWLVERGARALVFVSRSAGSNPDNHRFSLELGSLGCSVFTVTGKIENMEDVRRAVAAPSRAIKGVIHLAGILRDASFINMTYDHWTDVIKPKVDGALNLHRALEGQDLDFFFLASSLYATVEHPGQANYAASNCFLEGLCRYRHSIGLPASTLNIGAIKGVGYLSDNLQAKRKVAAQGLQFHGEREFLDFMRLSILNSWPLSASSWPSTRDSCHHIMGLNVKAKPGNAKNRPAWHRDRRLGIYDNLKASTEIETSTASTRLADFLSAVTNNPDILTEQSSVDCLAQEIGRKVLSFGFKPDALIDVSLNLMQLGMDSLMASEMSRWWRLTFGLEMTVLEIMNPLSLESLGHIVAEKLKKKLQVAADATNNGDQARG